MRANSHKHSSPLGEQLIESSGDSPETRGQEDSERTGLEDSSPERTGLEDSSPERTGLEDSDPHRTGLEDSNPLRCHCRRRCSDTFTSTL